MNSQASINQDNVHLLKETIELINTLTVDMYTHKSMLFNADTPGAHVRHVIEHYELFLEGISKGLINYDLRKRNLQLSSHPKMAIDKINELIFKINALTRHDFDRLIDIKMDTGSVCEAVKTSIARELQFLWSHHVHHNAIIKMILESSGEPVAKDFGVAASTKKYYEEKDQCAH